MSNPYEAVDISTIRIVPVGEARGKQVYHIQSRNHKAFDVCVFRQFLFDSLFELMEDEWHFGNDDAYAEFHENDIVLALSSRDAVKFESYGWLVQ